MRSIWKDRLKLVVPIAVPMARSAGGVSSGVPVTLADTFALDCTDRVPSGPLELMVALTWAVVFEDALGMLVVPSGGAASRENDPRPAGERCDTRYPLTRPAVVFKSPWTL